MNTKEFRAEFKRKYAFGEGAQVRRYKEVNVNFGKLKEGKLKAENTFEFEKSSYLFNPAAVREYDQDGRPIIKYFIGNENPIEELGDFEVQIDGKVVGAGLMYQTMDRGEMKEVIASTQKEPGKFDWFTLIIGGLMFLFPGLIIGWATYSHLFH